MHVQYNGVCETEVLSGCDLLRNTGGRGKTETLRFVTYVIFVTNDQN